MYCIENCRLKYIVHTLGVYNVFKIEIFSLKK